MSKPAQWLRYRPQEAFNSLATPIKIKFLWCLDLDANHEEWLFLAL